jgi:hypothetical protein
MDMSLHSFENLIFEKGAKNISWRKDSLFTNGAGKSGYLPAQTECLSP